MRGHDERLLTGSPFPEHSESSEAGNFDVKTEVGGPAASLEVNFSPGCYGRLADFGVEPCELQVRAAQAAARRDRKRRIVEVELAKRREHCPNALASRLNVKVDGEVGPIQTDSGVSRDIAAWTRQLDAFEANCIGIECQATGQLECPGCDLEIRNVCEQFLERGP